MRAKKYAHTHTRREREIEWETESKREREVEGKEGLTRAETETGRGRRVGETHTLSQARAHRHTHTHTHTHTPSDTTDRMHNKKNRRKISETKLPESVTPTHNHTRPLYAALTDERLDLMAKTSSQPLPRQILCV
jgi:hypothetical protein